MAVENAQSDGGALDATTRVPVFAGQGRSVQSLVHRQLEGELWSGKGAPSTTRAVEAHVGDAEQHQAPSVALEVIARGRSALRAL